MAALLAAAFAVLTAAVASRASALLRIDQTVVLAVNAFVAGHACLRTAAQLVSNVGSPVAVDVFVGIVAVALLLRRKAGIALLGVHYPSDVVGGLLLGTLCGLALAFRLPGPANLSRNDRKVAP